MDEYMNEELREKPNHAHYPICRGRLSDIEKHSRQIFFYTLIVCVIMAFFSVLCVPMHVIGWLPMIFNSEEISKGAFNVSFGFGFTQVLCCVAIVVFSVLNLGKRKTFGIVLFVIYMVLTISSIFFTLTGLDVITTIIGIMGMYYCRGVFRDGKDYQQLANTEGFPMFSVVLAEYDDQKGKPNFLHTKSGKDYYDSMNQQSAAPVAPVQQPQSYVKPQNPLGNMPELNTSGMSRSGASEGLFKPKSGKEGTISFSPLKLR